MGQGAGRLAQAVLPLVHRRRAQHLLQRARPACGQRPRRAGGPDLRQPRDPDPQDLHFPPAARRSGPFCGRPGGPGRGQRGPGAHLHADDPRGARRHVRLRPPGGRALGGLRWFRRPGARHPHQRRQAQGDRLGFLRHRSQPGHPLQAASGRGDRDGHFQAQTLHHRPAADAEGRNEARPGPGLGRGHGQGQTA